MLLDPSLRPLGGSRIWTQNENPFLFHPEPGQLCQTFPVGKKRKLKIQQY